MKIKVLFSSYRVKKKKKRKIIPAYIVHVIFTRLNTTLQCSIRYVSSMRLPINYRYVTFKIAVSYSKRYNFVRLVEFNWFAGQQILWVFHAPKKTWEFPINFFSHGCQTSDWLNRDRCVHAKKNSQLLQSRNQYNTVLNIILWCFVLDHCPLVFEANCNNIRRIT